MIARFDKEDPDLRSAFTTLALALADRIDQLDTFTHGGRSADEYLEARRRSDRLGG